MIDFTSPDLKSNPFPVLKELRTNAPLYRFDLPQQGHAWMVTRYDDALAIIKDPRIVKDIRRILPPASAENIGSQADLRSVFRFHMLSADPPDHTRLRRLVSKGFTPRMIELLRGRIQDIADELLDQMQSQGQMDLINDFAFPLPITVICELLGVPVEDQQNFRLWSNAFLNRSGMFQAYNEEMPELKAFVSYLQALIKEKRERPDDRLVSQLVSIEEAGDKLSEHELISMLFLLLVAGHETTVNLIGNGVLELLQHPDQWSKLRADPSLVGTAVEEILRYTSPVMVGTARWASEDIDMHGTLIAKGDMVWISLLATNTDPEHFSTPEELDITREENEHLAFGKGIHYCLGAPLARLEGQIALGTLVRRLPDLHLNVRPEELLWRPGLLMHGLEELPVAF